MGISSEKVAFLCNIQRSCAFYNKSHKIHNKWKKTICNHVAFYLHLIFNFMQQRRW